jgi:hypothetical protein
MTLLLSEPPRAGAAIMPPVGPAVQRRMLATARAIGGLIDPDPARANPRLQGCLAAPTAGILLTGSACQRPHLFAELDTLTRETIWDIIVLRYDALRGRVTYDIKLQSRPQWLRCYTAQPIRDGLQLVPDTSAGPVLTASALGLEFSAPGTHFAESASHPAVHTVVAEG